MVRLLISHSTNIPIRIAMAIMHQVKEGNLCLVVNICEGFIDRSGVVAEGCYS
jgi:hypothetical protein